MVTLDIGGLHASSQPVAIRTVLGSCIAACVYDPEAEVGGMNHFMLPKPVRYEPSLSTRYGTYAMEVLMNRILHLGGSRSRLRAKVFGGANVLWTGQRSPNVAQSNVAFVREFLDRERIPLDNWLVGGSEALEVVFFPQTARTFVRHLRAGSQTVLSMETRDGAMLQDVLAGQSAVNWMRPSERA